MPNEALNGRSNWQKKSGYNRRSKVEEDISRYKRVIGDALKSRDDARRVTEVKIAIKAVTEGTFSSYANYKLRAGDVLEVAPPKGRFIFEPNDKKTKNIAAFAAGSGITPILSIIKCALEEEVHSKVILVYGNKSTEDTMFLNELENYKGILMATTNFTHGFDPAFERRWMVKLRVPQPDAQLRRQLIVLKFGSYLEEEHIDCLAEKYEFTPGQLENALKAFLLRNSVGERSISIEQLLASEIHGWREQKPEIGFGRVMHYER